MDSFVTGNSSPVKVGDLITLHFGSKHILARVVDIQDNRIYYEVAYEKEYPERRIKVANPDEL